MIRIVTLLLVCLLALPAAAAPVTVRTGEHIGFTRVVISLPNDMSWEMGRYADGYVVRLPVEEGYNLRRFFDLIPRDRIADVSQDVAAGELRLALACDCFAEASIFGSRFLVVDITEGAPAADSPFEVRFDTAERVPEPAPPPPKERVALGPRVVPLLTEPTSLPPVGAPLPSPVQEPLPDAPADADSVPQPETTVQETVAALTQEIAQSLAQGLTQGLLDGDLQPAEQDDIAAAITQALPDAALPGITARTSVDPLAVAALAPEDQTQTGNACLPDAFFDLASWQGGGSFHAQLQKHRAGLFDDAGSADPDGVMALAQFYVAYGFGKEARQTLMLDAGNSQERIYLTALSRMIEGYPVDAALFATQVSCPSSVALWALLASDTRELDAQFDGPAIIRAFRALSGPVQPLLAPALSERLLQIGETETALQIMDTAASQAPQTAAQTLADVALNDALGEGEAAFAQIRESARTAARVSPDILTTFFDEGVRQGEAFQDADFLLADALRFEHAGTPQGAALADAQFRAYLSVNRFDAARGLLAARADAMTDAMRAQLTDQLLLDATERMEDGAFLRFIWTQEMSMASSGARAAVAARVAALGFADKAREIDGEASGVDIRPTQEPPRTTSEVLAAQVDGAGTDQQRAAGNASDAAILPAEVPSPLTLPLASSAPTLASSRALLESAADARAVFADLLEQSLPDF